MFFKYIWNKLNYKMYKIINVQKTNDEKLLIKILTNGVTYLLFSYKRVYGFTEFTK